jgi:VanZ family protein
VSGSGLEPARPLPLERAPRAVRRAALCGALAVAYAAFIFWVSSQAHPFPRLPSALFSHDRLLHAVGYALLGGLVAGALSAARFGAARAILIAAAIASGYGASDELHQAFVPGREPDLVDWAADTIGAVAGAALALAALRRRGAPASIRR